MWTYRGMWGSGVRTTLKTEYWQYWINKDNGCGLLQAASHQSSTGWWEDKTRKHQCQGAPLWGWTVEDLLNFIAVMCMHAPVFLPVLTKWWQEQNTATKPRLFLVPFSKIFGNRILAFRSTKWSLFINFLHRWVLNRETNLTSIINSSLEIIYCSTTLSNYDLIRLKKFISKLHPGVMEWVLSVIHT